MDCVLGEKRTVSDISLFSSSTYHVVGSTAGIQQILTVDSSVFNQDLCR